MPLGDALAPAIARLRQIAAEAGNHLLLGDGPPHPDAALLDLCGEALHHLRAAETAYQARPWHTRRLEEPWTDADRRRDKDLMAEYGRHNGQAAKLLRRAKKLRAVTAAGIYSKALCVAASRTGAAELAMTLAADLIGNPALRASLWAADPDPAPAPAGNVVALGARSRAASSGCRLATQPGVGHHAPHASGALR
ncbi:MAG: hypothetical protein M0Z28_10245 [Rhodospirillales bacterium]|nr:hypothetical protein [Rhodospirillales bacterium]